MTLSRLVGLSLFVIGLALLLYSPTLVDKAVTAQVLYFWAMILCVGIGSLMAIGLPLRRTAKASIAVKSIGPEGVRIEHTFTGTIKGFGRFPSGTNMGAIDFVVAPDESSSGSGQGIFTSKDGEAVTWKIHLFGKREKGRNKSFGILKFWTTSKKIAWLNGTIHALEGIDDPKTMEGSDTGNEWK